MTLENVMKAADRYAIYDGSRESIDNGHHYTMLWFIPHDGPFPRSVFLVDGVVDHVNY